MMLHAATDAAAAAAAACAHLSFITIAHARICRSIVYRPDSSHLIDNNSIIGATL